MKTGEASAVPTVLAITLMGCASTVHVERDEAVNLAQYKTFRWVETKKIKTITAM